MMWVGTKNRRDFVLSGRLNPRMALRGQIRGDGTTLHSITVYQDAHTKSPVTAKRNRETLERGSLARRIYNPEDRRHISERATAISSERIGLWASGPIERAFSIDRLRFPSTCHLCENVLALLSCLRRWLCSDLFGGNRRKRRRIHSMGVSVLLPIWLLAIVVVQVGTP